MKAAVLGMKSKIENANRKRLKGPESQDRRNIKTNQQEPWVNQ